MLLTKRTMQTMVVPDGFVCSVCKKKYEQDDWGEVQESLHWSLCGGYGSVFGDGTTVSIDMCQTCVSRILGVYLEIEENYCEQD